MKTASLILRLLAATFVCAFASCSGSSGDGIPANRSVRDSGNAEHAVNNDLTSNIAPVIKNSSNEHPFRKELALSGIKFVVESRNTSSANTVTVTPSGLSISNDAFTSPVNGEVDDAQVGDLNSDGSPEVYVFIRQRSGHGKISVIGYGTNSRKSMSEFVLPEPDPESKEYVGYNGEDKFEITGDTLSRSFPLFDKKGDDFVRTGRERLIHYKIRPGEATWRFYIAKSIDR